MTLGTLLIWILVLGFFAWLAGQIPGIDASFVKIARIVLLVVALILCLEAFGVVDVLSQPLRRPLHH